jgi:hypothetical protein
MTEGGWTIGQFIVGMLISGVGFVLVWQSDWMMRNFGRVPFAEKYLSTEGGTRLFFKLLGILVMIIGIMHATDLLDPFGAWMINKMFGGVFTPKM